MNIAILALTKEGRILGDSIASGLKGSRHYRFTGKIADKIEELWSETDAFICIMAAGIVVRSIANLIQDKNTDPCVLVLDHKGNHVISLLSGHLGGGNELSQKVAAITGGKAILTTASDVAGKTAIDLWAARNNLVIKDKKKLTQITAHFVEGKPLRIFHPRNINGLPDDFELADSPDHSEIHITYNKNMTSGPLCCIPKSLYLGVGCNRGTSVEDITVSFTELCYKYNMYPEAFSGICTIDVKHDEPGILQFAEMLGLDVHFFSRDEINGVQDISISSAALKAVGAKGVAEPTALLGAAGDGSSSELIIPKLKWKDVTMAVAERIQLIWD